MTLTLAVVESTFSFRVRGRKWDFPIWISQIDLDMIFIFSLKAIPRPYERKIFRSFEIWGKKYGFLFGKNKLPFKSP